MTPLVILGSSGHAAIVIDAVIQQKLFEPIGLLSKDIGTENDVLGVPIVGDDGALQKLIETHQGLCVHIAIGQNDRRKRLADAIMRDHPNTQFASIIHPTAIVSDSAEIGPGCFVAAGVIINTGAKIKSHVIVNTAGIVEHECRIGDFVFVGPASTLAGNVNVGDGTMIGIGTSVIPRISIGAHCVVGAGSCVISDIADGKKFVGVPAREIGSTRK